jgi:hypothetical protein
MELNPAGEQAKLPLNKDTASSDFVIALLRIYYIMPVLHKTDIWSA